MAVFVYGTLRDRGAECKPAMTEQLVFPHGLMIMLPCWPEGTISPCCVPMRMVALRLAEGVLLTNLSAADIAALDAFEGETYQRRTMM